MELAALEGALTVPMVNINLPTLAVNVVIVGHHHSGDVRIVHLENMNIMIMGKFASQLNSNHH